MAAGQGFKTFTTGEVLTAADTNGYLMQGVLVFADAAARTAAITSPQEGQTSYLKDTDTIQVYSGSAWVTKSGAPSPLTTKGDLYTYSTTDARLGVGANDTVLTADSTAATGLKWAAPAGGGSNYSLLNAGGTALSGSSSVTVSGISGQEKLVVVVSGAKTGTAYQQMFFRINTDSGTNYIYSGFTVNQNYNAQGSIAANSFYFGQGGAAGTDNVVGTMFIDSGKSAGFKYVGVSGGGEWQASQVQGIYKGSAAVTSITVFGSNNFTAGRVYVYGSAA